jgi:hypothetical protein
MIAFRPDLAKRLLRMAREHSAANDVPAAETGVALLVAGLALLSSGMDDEQVTAVIAQAFEITAPLRRETEARWKRTGFRSRGEPE